jgi:uncharacterized membrane protein
MRRAVWTVTFILVTIGLLAAARRIFVLLYQPAMPGFGPAAALDVGFARHRALTLLHILPASLFFSLAPLQFHPGIRRRHVRWHRWSGRVLVVLGGAIGASALVMSYTMAIGGANETAATTLFAILFLIFLGAGYRSIRRHRVADHREWMIRAFGVALGVATTRPIVGGFFAAGNLSPHEFFGTAFWLGFTLTLLGAEAWIHYSRKYLEVA